MTPEDTENTARAVVDASAVVDLLLGTPLGPRVATAVHGVELLAPAHLDAEVLSAFGRLHRAGVLTTRRVTQRLHLLSTAPITRMALTDLLAGAWARRDNLRLVDALYVELATRERVPLITTDARLAAASPVTQLVT